MDLKNWTFQLCVNKSVGLMESLSFLWTLTSSNGMPTKTIHTVPLKKQVGVWQEGSARIWHISLWIPLNDLKVKVVRDGYQARLEANNFTIANLQPVWTHCIFTWYMNASERLYQVAVYLINGLNCGRNFWENWSQWIWTNIMLLRLHETLYRNS